MKHLLIAALHRVVGLNANQLATRLRQLDEKYGFYNPEQQKALQKLYVEKHSEGVAAVGDDVFTDSTSVMFEEIRDRFRDYVRVQEEDLDFIGRLAAGEQPAIDEILKRSGQPGFENDFDYDMYQKYYIDGSRKLEESDVEAPEGIDNDKYYFVADMAYTDGVESKIWGLASRSIQGQADEMLDER